MYPKASRCSCWRLNFDYLILQKHHRQDELLCLGKAWDRDKMQSKHWTTCAEQMISVCCTWTKDKFSRTKQFWVDMTNNEIFTKSTRCICGVKKNPCSVIIILGPCAWRKVGRTSLELPYKALPACKSGARWGETSVTSTALNYYITQKRKLGNIPRYYTILLVFKF